MRTPTTSFRLDKITLNMLDDLAQAARRSRAQVVTLLIEAAWCTKDGEPRSTVRLMRDLGAGLAARGPQARQRRMR